ncbi:uncharacterized protein [Cardiocondyla obscurior]|uniref:uncharacterized protein n=1 Tax=Cardiocondyla obscurior TaxID=286306 RepID=UPI0039658B31
MTSAPFLATRCLKHLAETHESECPVGATSIIRDFYINDLLTGADTLTEAKTAREQIVLILRRGQMELRKWLANHQELLPEGKQGDRSLSVLSDEGERKILGVQWNSQRDEFIIEAHESRQKRRITMRAVLAETASLFDPFGIVGPIVVIVVTRACTQAIDTSCAIKIIKTQQII